MIKSRAITIDQIVVQVEGNIVSNMAGDKVMLNVQNGKYYNLGETGGEIWERMNEPIPIRKLVESLENDYDIKKEACKEQVMNFLTSLADERLINVISE